MHEALGEDMDNIPLENADGQENEEYEGRFRRGPWDK